MLRWVEATIICFQHREAEVLQDRRVLDFLDEGRATKRALAMLVLHPDDLVDIVTIGYPSGGSIAPDWVREVAWGCELRDIGDDCLEHSHYGQDLVGASTTLGCGKAGSHFRTKGVEAGVAGLPPRSIALQEGRLPGDYRVLSILATSGPHSSAKMLLGDSSGSKGQHNVVRLTSVRAAQ
ncbi:hypothetical protein BHM03_00001654 [Ensete ventricosum]|nr:hypothetical protein BHM03_00001654 [Ensete ventricosum]